MVVVGAEAVVENGGIVNKLGTYQIAVCAKACNKPFYVAAESYKFCRIYPLNQKVKSILSLADERGGVRASLSLRISPRSAPPATWAP